MVKRKRTKGQTMIYKTLHRKLKIEQNEPHREQMVNSGAPERQAASSPLPAIWDLKARTFMREAAKKVRAYLDDSSFVFVICTTTHIQCSR
jgi:uncharacterized protein YfaQ (DUF2300 family)